jgi:enterochelin esterase family protein
MEYLFEVVDRNDRRSTTTDPTNPNRAAGAFGDKSVVLFPGYRPPAWLAEPAAAGAHLPLQVEAPGLDGTVDVIVWTPQGLADDDPAPLLLVHDGPEFAELGGFTQYLGAAITAGRLPPLRAALLDPGERNEWYSANPNYAATVADTIVAALPAATVRIGIGASLGALAMLHLHRTEPEVLDGLFLQSGSFFTAEHDPQEARFSGYAAVTAFVSSVQDAESDEHPVPAVLTCGVPEENLANNAAMTEMLRRLGYPAELVEVRDAHNYTAWRDALDPHLTDLVRTVVGTDAP